MKHIVNRQGSIERFDERKVYASCYAACLVAQMKHKDAEKICDRVAKEIKAWVKNKEIVTSTQIFKQAIKSIKKHDSEVAFLYETHREIS